MKKLIFCIAIACIFSTTAAFSQIPVIANGEPKKLSKNGIDAEITRIMHLSHDLNLAAGVVNGDSISVGQHLAYKYPDGYVIGIVAKKGDYQRKIINDQVLPLEKMHGKVVAAVTPAVGFQHEPDNNQAAIQPVTVSKADNSVFLGMFLALAIGAIAAYVINRLINKRNAEASLDPVTSGRPMKAGGVTDSEAHAYANVVASRMFNQPNLNVTNITRGTLSGTNVEVSYRGEATPKRRTFNNEPAYRGLLTVNETLQFIYFLQACGNDARIGNYFSGQNITFVEDEVLQPVQAPVIEERRPAELEEVIAQQQPVINVDLANMVKTLTDQTTGLGHVELMFENNGMKLQVKITKNLIATNHTNHVSPEPGVETSLMHQ